MGMRQACPGEMVTYTCTVNQGFLLEWIVKTFILGNTDISTGIQFTSTDTIGRSFDCNGVAAVQCEDFDFVANLTNTANRTVVMRTTLADITSTLTFTAVVRLNGTVVQCRGLTATGFPAVNSTFNVAGQSMLLHVACLAAKFGYLEIKFTL